MSEHGRDRDLGMDRKITRRDFLNGVSVGVGGAVLASNARLLAALDGPAPRKTSSQCRTTILPRSPDFAAATTRPTNMRTRCAMTRSGTRPPSPPPPPRPTTSSSSEAASAGWRLPTSIARRRARRRASSSSTITTTSADTPSATSSPPATAWCSATAARSRSRARMTTAQVAKGLLTDLGIDTSVFYKAYDQKLYSKLGTAVFFDRETFGQDRLVTGLNTTPWPEFLAQAPLSDAARRDIARVYADKVDYLPGLTREQKRAKLAKISYADFLTKTCNVTPEALPFFQTWSHDLFGVGIDAAPALSCYEAGDDYGAIHYPGFDGLDLGEREKEEPYIFHFPDGNASIARLLVRSLIPAAIPGHDMYDVVTARADYSQLDRASSPVRIRLNSTVVKVKHDGPPTSAKQVHVLYMRDGKLQGVRAGTRGDGLLQHDDSVPVSGAAAEAARGAAIRRQGSAGLHARRDSQLAGVRQAGSAAHRVARQLSLLHVAGFSREPG